MFQHALASAKTFAANEGSPYDVVQTPSGLVTAVGRFMAAELYPNRSVYRVFPDGSAVNLNDMGVAS